MKQALRRMLKQKRGAISLARRKQAAHALLDALYATDYNILSFFSIHDEIDTGLLNDHLILKHRLLLPRIENFTLCMHLVKDLDLVLGRFGIPEPRESCAHGLPSLILVPALGFSRNGHRIGYGGGYYDRLLAQHPSIPRWGVGFREQLIETASHESYDVPMDHLLLV